MTKRFLMLLFAITLSIALTPSNAFAKGHGDEHDKGKHFDRDHDADSGRPPGWSHGRKTGWKGGDEPPGLAKKHHHDWDRDRDRDRHVHHTTHRTHHTYRRPATTTTTTTTTRRYPSSMMTGKPGSPNTVPHTTTTTTTTTRRPADFNDRDLKH